MTSEKSEGEARFIHALEFVERVRATRPELPTELIDAVLDGLVDLLQRRADFGQTRSAVFALGRRQLAWRIKDWQRLRFEADGEVRNHPASAQSLDRKASRIDGEGGRLYDSARDRSCHDPEQVCLDREELGELIDRAREDGLNTLRMVVAEMTGLTAQELAESVGVEVNTVHQWKSRFRARHRRDSR